MLSRSLVLLSAGATVLGIVALMQLGRASGISEGAAALHAPSPASLLGVKRSGASVLQRRAVNGSEQPGPSTRVTTGAADHRADQPLAQVDLEHVLPADEATDMIDMSDDGASWDLQQMESEVGSVDGECVPYEDDDASAIAEQSEAFTLLATLFYEEKHATGEDAQQIRTAIIDAAREGTFGDLELSEAERNQFAARTLDVNGDGLGDLGDISTLILMQGVTTTSALDLDRDGVCGFTDVIQWLQLFTWR